MTNEIMVVDGFQIPAYLQGKAPIQSDFGKVGGLPKITMGRTTFKIEQDGQEKIMPSPLPVVILAVSPVGNHYNRSYYAQAYQQGSTEAPDCSSSDGLTPDAGDLKQAVDCKSCQWAQWGSDGKGQACKQGLTLFVVPANAPTGAVFQFRVAPTSLKPVAAYGAKLSAAGLPSSGVVTALSITSSNPANPDEGYQILQLDLAGFLEDAVGTASIARADGPEIQALVIKPVPVGLPAPAQYVPPVEPAPQVQAPPTENWGATAHPEVPQPVAKPPAREDLVFTNVQQAPPAAVVEEQAPPTTGQPAPAQEHRAPIMPAGVIVDSAGVEWSADLHSSGKSQLKDGTWKKKRGYKAPVEAAPAVVVPAAATVDAAQGGEELNNILNQWG